VELNFHWKHGIKLKRCRGKPAALAELIGWLEDDKGIQEEKKICLSKVREVRGDFHDIRSSAAFVLALLEEAIIMKVLDLGCRTGSAVAAWQAHGDTVIGVDWEDFGQQIIGDFTKEETWEIIDNVTPIWEDDVKDYDFIWFSPDCAIFSVGNFAAGHFCPETYEPLTERAKREVEGIEFVIKKIQERKPRLGWIAENPRSLFRKMPFVKGLDMVTVSYCQYHDTRMKPTDLFGNIPYMFEPKLCKNGDKCHIPAPRGSRSGTQGMDKTTAGMIPYELSNAIRTAAIRSFETPMVTLRDFI